MIKFLVYRALVYGAAAGVLLGLDPGAGAIASPQPGAKNPPSIWAAAPVSKGATRLKQSNPPPPPTNPGSSAPGGRRNASACPQDAGAAPNSATPGPLLTALSPITKPGLTLATHPTFLVYVPTTNAESAEFSLRNQAGQGLYRTTVPLPTTPAIVSISLPDQTAALAVGKTYTWTFAIICDPNDRLEDQFVTGTVQRLDLDPARAAQLEQASASDRLALYEQDGVWYDALALLAELRRTDPEDTSLATTWHELLQSGGIDTPVESNSISY
ncbi:DUF928 domain-containing protein [Nodosilinea nodulosa]|uniref:DUF928 domain-containing protein n=1 Tax=Nodosilinea nodulosa TaxID=416001 RepID=UPI0002E6F647|nr:DUF928 domain-containing protein [Nodosilinea nodulosa]